MRSCMNLVAWIFASLKARWKRIALLGLLLLIIGTTALNSALFDAIDAIHGMHIFAPTENLNFSQFQYPSSLEFLRAKDKYWSRYNASSYHKNGERCGDIQLPKELNGTRVTVSRKQFSFEDLAQLHSNVHYGGHWYPENCTAQFRTAIIIPYRNREEHLGVFLNNIHPFLQTQYLDYAIFIVEQKSGTMFNRGMLMNIGFNEARKLYDWQCYVFHDVDLLPEDERNFYTCPGGPRHLSAAVDVFDYKLLYATLFGGATILKKEDVIKTNGYSNVFWGWGGEDDDFYERTRFAKLNVQRYSMDIARYTMLRHERDKENPVNPRRYSLLRKSRKRYRRDGVNSLRYDLVKVEAKRLFTWVYVDVHGSPSS